ncbi:MAG: peptidyl-prolyl cis-trans isomerase [Oscillospiraceae bacterium]|jgi:hypothetical protein|nr:peptidyl-prolyl cis-trans isomerase [Oscillospiraceae bacterium]
MSASREKQKRTEMRQGGVEPIKRMKPPVSNTRRKVIIGVIMCLVGIFIAGVFVYGSGVLHSTLSVVNVDGTRVTPIEYGIYLTNAKWSMFNQYYSQIGMAVFDPNAPLRDQSYDEASGTTWLDFFNDQTVGMVKTMLVQYNQAMKDGTQLTQEDTESIDTAFGDFVDAASEANVGVGEYLRAYYGPGVTEDLLRKSLERQVLASRWAKDTAGALSNDQLETYYGEHRNDYDIVGYESYTLDGVLTQGTDEQKAEFYNKVAEMADEMLSKVTTAEAFNALAAEYSAKRAALAAEYAPEPSESPASSEPPASTPPPSASPAPDGADGDDAEDTPAAAPSVTTLHEYVGYSGISDENVKSWLFDDARVLNDKTSFEVSQKITVYSFISKGRDERNYLVDVRHILGKFNLDDSDPTPEQKESARIAAEETLAQWKAGEATEDSFAALANEISDDNNGEVTNGGLYADLTASSGMVEPFADWYLDPARYPGETGIVETEFGYHIMYFVANKEGAAWSMGVKNAMLTDETNALTEAAKIRESGFARFIAGIGK